MRIEALIASLQHELRQNNVLLDAENGNRLGNVKVGDVLQGKVVRDLGNGQWLMRFEQAEVSVKSQTAMAVGDLFRGRVRETGKQVVLERLPNIAASVKGDSGAGVLSSLIGTTGYAGLLSLIKCDKNENQIAQNNKKNGAVVEQPQIRHQILSIFNCCLGVP